MTPREYFAATRQARYSLVFAVPLLLMYEALAAAVSGETGVRNGADVLLKTIFVSLGGHRGVALFGILLLGVGGWLIAMDWRSRGAPRSKVFMGMIGESLLYATLLGGVVSYLTTLLLSPALNAVVVQGGDTLQRLDLPTQLVVSLGAGLYEELLFRVLLVGALIALGKALGWGKAVSIGVAVVGSALIFSGFHYIGPMGDQFAVSSFTFRAIAGLLLSALYVARGFGITAWSHALYDVGIALALT